MPFKYGKRTHEFLGAFLFPCLVFHDFEGFLIKKIIPLTLVGDKMIIANLAPRWLSIISYPTRSHGKNC